MKKNMQFCAQVPVYDPGISFEDKAVVSGELTAEERMLIQLFRVLKDKAKGAQASNPASEELVNGAQQILKSLFGNFSSEEATESSTKKLGLTQKIKRKIVKSLRSVGATKSTSKRRTQNKKRQKLG
jgi:hypothetical protein